MREYFLCEYEIEDGYVGASRPQRFKIYADQINEKMTKARLKELFEELLYEDFQTKVEPVSDDIEEFILWAQDILEDEDGKGDDDEAQYD